METSEVLNKAADVIEERGWWQEGDGIVQPLGGQCASNALALIARGAGDSVAPSQRAFWEHVDGREVADIWHWNDAPSRTAAEVVEALRACAVIEQAKETEGRLIHGPVVEPDREAVA